METIEERNSPAEHTEAYDTRKVAMIKKHLDFYNAKGNPLYYDIAVDDMKVVEKTNDPKEFEGYKEFIEGADKLIITIYNRSPKSPKVSKKTTFSLKEAQTQQKAPTSVGLSGLELDGLINSKVDEKVSIARERWDNGQTKEKLEAKIKEVAEKDATIQKLTEENQLLKSNKAKSDLKLIDIATSMLETFIRRNPHIIEKIPGVENLAGLIRRDNVEKEAYARESNEESEVSFKKKSGATLSAEEEKYISILKDMEDEFNPEELDSVMNIITHLSENHGDIATVEELLNTEKTTNKK
jgi:hypothetical protein